MPTQCFWMDRTGLGEVALRRYHSQESGAGWTCETGWHNASNWLGVRVEYDLREHHYDDRDRPVIAFPLATDVYAEPAHDDPRWPMKCDLCDYEFVDTDNWQVFIEEIYIRADNGEERVLHWTHNPPTVPTAEWGALWNGEWQKNMSWTNPDKPDDGIWLMARCPSITDRYGNDWGADGRASGGGFWKRTGDPRNPPSLTMEPSIQTGDYHGFLQQGVFTDHVG